MSGTAGRFVSGVVDFLTVGAVGTITFGVGGIVLFNIGSTMPRDPIVAKALCFFELPYESDEGTCFKTRLKEGFSEMESQFEQQKQQREREFQQKERDLDATIKQRTEEVAALEQRRVALEGEKAEIAQARSQLEGQLKKLGDIERSSTSFNLFSVKPWKRGLSVTTGIEYKSFVQSQEWTKAWCYVQFDMDSGVRAQLDLGKRLAGGEETAGDVSASVLDAGKFTAADVLEARALCAFPAAA